jgi:RimJ/RimL family protein N-acetyltransferase
VVLREKRIEDVEADFAWRVDPELASLDATTPLRLSLKEYTRYFQDELEYPSPWSVRLAVDTLEGEHIGNVMYYDVDERKRHAELGIMIGVREYWDRGYGTDVVNTVLRHIFADTGIERVYLHTLEWNERAKTAFKKTGFSPMRKVSRDGHNFILMEILRSDWQANHLEEDSGVQAQRDRSSADIGGDRSRIPD